MYTLVLIVIAFGSGGSVQTEVTHFPTPTKQICEGKSKLLVKDSTKDIQIKTFCVTRE